MNRGFEADICADEAARPDPAAYQRQLDTYFDSAAGYWSDVYRRQDVNGAIYQERRRRVLEFCERLDLPPGSSVLEIGCGAGFTSVTLALRGYHVHAADTVPAMLKLARQHASEAGVGHRIRMLLADTHHLPFGDESFRLVLAIGVIPWLPSAAPAIREMARVLAPGGGLVVSADHTWGLNRVLDPTSSPLTAPIRERLRKVLRRRANGARAVVNSRREIDSALAAAGLRPESGATLGFGPFTVMRRRLLPEATGLKVHHRMQALADRGVPVFRSAGAHYVVAARKK